MGRKGRRSEVVRRPVSEEGAVIESARSLFLGEFDASSLISMDYWKYQNDFLESSNHVNNQMPS